MFLTLLCHFYHGRIISKSKKIQKYKKFSEQGEKKLTNSVNYRKKGSVSMLTSQLLI